jgi:hypothetical protein
MHSFTYRLLLFILVSIPLGLAAQDTLPKITVANKGGGKVVVSWINNYPVVKQITLQRSNDSLKNYTSIYSIPSPSNKNNGVVDARNPTGNQFYRVYILLDSGRSVFSKPQRPFFDTAKKQVIPVTPVKPPVHKDSVIKVTPPPKEVYMPSKMVFTAREGNVNIILPNASPARPYQVKFFEENGTPIFELKKVTEKELILDKVNFLHAGWFLFEVYEEGRLVEKHKLLVPKDKKP